LKKMTEDNVKAALAGESQAHIKYLAFATKAGVDKLPNIARAFSADNLADARGGENFEVEEMYPAYLKVAEAQGEKTALTYFNYAFQAEKVHRGIYERAREAVAKGQDLPAVPIHVCGVCGFTMEGTAPDKCPVCGTPKSKFTAF